MKKTLFTLLLTIATVLSCIFGFSACGVVEFKISFVVDNEVYATVSTSGNEVISMPENPTKDDYTFDGWYWDENTWEKPFTANSLLDTPLSGDMKVHAKFNKNQTPSEDTGISFNTLTVDGTKVYGKVSNDTAEFSFIDEITVKGNATYVVDNDKDCNSPINSKTVDLVAGDNTFYILETIGNDVKLFTVTIRRIPMYDVAFDTNGGTAIKKQVIEEDHLATEPESPTKAGYTFTGWDYDFTQPITQNTKITASWSTNKDTKYTVNYYLENLDDYNYTLYESVELEGETDTTVSADIKEYEHFTYYMWKGTGSGKIKGDGSQVLSVYYTRNTYTLSVNNSDAGTITNSGTYKYGKEITSEATLRLGYELIGWYSGEELLTTDNSYTFTADKNVTAKLALKEEMSNFNFTSTATTCSITGVKDKTVTEIIVPDYVTSISKGAFSYYSSLESITLPFVGATKDGTENTHFGYIFGATYYHDNDDYVPSSLKSVTVIGGTIFDYTFSNCSCLTNVTIGEGVTSIGSFAFYYCTSLTSVEIGNGVTIIGTAAFLNCIELTDLIIGNSVTIISPGAFDECHSLTYVEIPDSVTTIENFAFEDCSSLTEVFIGNGVTSIGTGAFYNCDSLTSVYYKGTAEEWLNISINSSNDKLTNATVYYYSETKPTTSGNYWYYDENGIPTVW